MATIITPEGRAPTLGNGGSVAGQILLTGGNGQVGGAVLTLLQSLSGDLFALNSVLAPTRSELDMSDAAALRSLVRHVRPRWIVNAAAYTAVDKAESDSALAFAINDEAMRVLGQEAAAIGAAVISFSTDYVFPGIGDRPWIETDATGPLGVYGASKLAGEQGLAQTGAAHFLFRTSWVYGATGNNFLRTILRLAREREEMKIVADQHGAPTWSHELARLVMHTISHVEAEVGASGRTLSEVAGAAGGIYHACAAGETTWFGFASEFLRLAKLAQPQQNFARLLPVPSSDYPTPAKRPLNSRMNCEKLQQRLGFAMPHWRESVAQVMEQLSEI
jgi:dTDP-4-dehydrorhamnose reductase